MSAGVAGPRLAPGWFPRTNSTYHSPALKTFGAIVLAHWVEHVFQAVQIWALGWPRPAAGGALGLAQPWLVESELLHYGFALFMIAGFFLLLPAFTGTARTWWLVALAVQFWHHIEHAFLLAQAQSGLMFLGNEAPTSFLQLWVPRPELHLLYNAAVTLPMVVAIYLHLRPSRSGEAAVATCSCAKS